MERLQKYLSSCGVASRRKSEELIISGKVSVNGQIVKELGFKVTDKDEVLVEGKQVLKSEKEYYILYKPEKTICSVKDEKGRLTVIDLIDTKEKIFPVGRLDYDTSGLLLLTNDGEITNKLTHPKGNIEKIITKSIEYKIKVVEQDEFELNERRVLNLGHTFGHAFEISNKCLHGEGVAKGLMYVINNPLLKIRVKNILNKLNIPLNYFIDKEEVFNLIKNDKKRNDDKISLVKVNYIERYVIEDVNLETIEKMIERGE